MSAEERIRYDRQIRLWGLTAQQRLMQTGLVFYGIAGPASEVAKNMALAGVRSVAVIDSHPVTRDDVSHSFLLQPSAAHEEEEVQRDATRECAACVRLHTLNPFVSISRGRGDSEDGMVVFVQATTMTGAHGVLKQMAPSPKLAVVTFSCGSALSLSLFFRPAPDAEVGLGEQLMLALSSETGLAEKPAVFQQVVLALHLQNTPNSADMSFAQRLLHATALVDKLHLFALEPRHVDGALAMVGGARTAPPSAVSATVAGASIAQYVMQLISEDDGHGASNHKLPYGWMLCDTAAMDVLVGDL